MWFFTKRTPFSTQDRFAAFISYSSNDLKEAIALQKALERFRAPKELIGVVGTYGPVPAALGKVLLDRTDLSAAPVISDEITSKLARSSSLIVLCSRTAADPKRWVSREIDVYRRVCPQGPIYSVLVRDDPPECFPSALLTIGPRGQTIEPLAADMRPGSGGLREAVLKLASGMLGLDYDLLRKKRAAADRRRRRILALIGGIYAASITGLAVAVTNSSITLLQSKRAAIAVHAKQSNDSGATDRALLLAAASIPPSSSVFERTSPSAQAQGVRALLSNRLLAVGESVGGDLTALAPKNKRYFLLSSRSGAIQAFDSASLERVSELPSLNVRALAFSISEDETMLGVSTDSGKLLIIDANSGATVHSSEATRSQSRTLAFSRTGNLIVVGYEDGKARVYDLSRREWIAESPQHTGPVLGASFSWDESLVMSGSYGSDLLEWKIADGTQTDRSSRPGTVNNIRSGYEGGISLVTYALATKLSIFMNKTPWTDPAQLSIDLPAPAVHASIKHDSLTIVASSWAGRAAYIVDITSKRVIGELKHPDWVDAAYFVNEGTHILTFCRDGFVRLWLNPTNAPRRIYSFVDKGQTRIEWTRDSKRIIATGGNLKTVTIDVSSGSASELFSHPCPTDPPQARFLCWGTSLQVISDQLSFLATTNGRIEVFNHQDGKSIWAKTFPGQSVHAFPYPSPLELGTVRSDGNLEIFSLLNGASVAMKRLGAALPAAGFIWPSSTNKTQTRFAFSRGSRVAVESLPDRNETWVSSALHRGARSIEWSPDGRTLAVGTNANAVYLFSGDNLESSLVVRLHSSWINNLSFSPDSRFLLASSEKEVLLLDVQSGDLILKPEIPGDQLFEAKFSPDGKRFAVAGASGTIDIFDFPALQADVRAQVCKSMPAGRRSFSSEELQEMPFISNTERTPCDIPPIASVEYVRRLVSYFVAHLVDSIRRRVYGG